jgi:hypothetical protein
MTSATRQGWRRFAPAPIGGAARRSPAMAFMLIATAAAAVALAGCTGSGAAGSGGSNQAGAAANGAAGQAGGTAAGADAAGAGATGAGTDGTGKSIAADVPGIARTLLCPPAVTLGRLGFGSTIPAGFQAVAVVRCIPTGAVGAVGAAWADARKEVAVSGLGPLLAALREPSAQHVRPGPAAGCPLPALSAVRLALVGATGAVIYPRIPVTACGTPTPSVTASLSALHWIVLSMPVVGNARAPQPVVTGS